MQFPRPQSAMLQKLLIEIKINLKRERNFIYKKKILGCNPSILIIFNVVLTYTYCRMTNKNRQQA